MTKLLRCFYNSIWRNLTLTPKRRKTMSAWVVILEIDRGDKKVKKNLTVRKCPLPIDARMKAIKRYEPEPINIIDILPLFRYNEIKAINDYLKTKRPKTHMPHKDKECRACKKVLKRKHAKWKFRNTENGRFRHYCEDCVEDIGPITWAKLQLIRVY